MGITCIQAYGDSLLVVRQVLGIYDVCKQELIAYHAAVMRLIDKFYFFKIDHVRRSQNSQADALAKLASALTLPMEGEIEIVIQDRKLIPSNIDR